MHSSSFLLHSSGGGGGGTSRAAYPPASSSFGASGGAPAFTTLPPIFSARPAQSGSYSTRVASTGGLSSRSQQAHRGASTQRLRTSTHLKAALPQFHKSRDAGDPGGGGGSGARLASSRGMLIASGNGSRTVGGRKVASNADMRGQSSGAAGVQRHHGPNDEATIGSDGTVTFGPNLSLLMSSLAVRFDEHHDADGEGRASGGGSTTGAVERGGGGGGHGGEGGPTSPRGSQALAASRRRAEKKRREWTAMSALAAKAKDDKAAAAAAGAGAGGADAQRQQHWFMARFNYPIVYEPQQQPAQQQQRHQPSYSSPLNRRQGSHTDLLHSSSSGAIGTQRASPPAQSQSQSAHHAHLLHTAGRAATTAEQQQQQAQAHAHAHAVSVEEEAEEEAQDDR